MKKDCKHKPRDNKFGVTWCIKCGWLFTKSCGKPLLESDKIVKENGKVNFKI